jgi:hypothetical protein
MTADHVSHLAKRADIARLEKRPLAKACGHDKEVCFPIAPGELLGDV